MATPVSELELPVVDGADRGERRDQIDAAREQHWLARAPMGYLLTRYEDCVKVLRDARWFSALALLNQT
ncbi:MAG: hypothetical protein AAGF02_20710, partial [Actinomycetota bacterium]